MNTIEEYLEWNDDWVDVRKKPVQVQAMLLNECIVIHTLEGNMIGNKGDYLIKGIDGEYYPCKPDIFNRSYEVVKP